MLFREYFVLHFVLFFTCYWNKMQQWEITFHREPMIFATLAPIDMPRAFLIGMCLAKFNPPSLEEGSRNLHEKQVAKSPGSSPAFMQFRTH